MGQTEVVIFIVLVSIIVLIFVIGIILFVIQYRKRKMIHEQEKEAIDRAHKLELLNNQLKVQQQTMQFIGSEIHDSVAQKLTLASIYSQKLEFENKAPAIGENIRQISTIINDSLVELRELSRSLTIHHIQDAALTTLLREECDKVNSTGTCKMLLEAEFDDMVSMTVKSFLLRVLQEFIQNSLKHSGCSVIKVEIKKTSEGLLIFASDNGRGFDSSHVLSSGIGLNNMQRRMRLIGGRFDLQTAPGKGTQVKLFIENKKLLSEL